MTRHRACSTKRSRSSRPSGRPACSPTSRRSPAITTSCVRVSAVAGTTPTVAQSARLSVELAGSIGSGGRADYAGGSEGAAPSVDRTICRHARHRLRRARRADRLVHRDELSRQWPPLPREAAAAKGRAPQRLQLLRDLNDQMKLLGLDLGLGGEMPPPGGGPAR